ncbi:hypothetical protein [Halomonas halocynthiae]|uniref:hypothetical protein n=1 Tax=Halomonas halocynthiae TaxID=176290 RepID=UPI0003F4F9AF|nr:hypothetical protein [Halomonas halocynthiae]
MINRFMAQACAVLWCLSASISMAADTPPTQLPQGFTANYHLSVSGWPDADISHRLTQVSSDGWRASMKAKIAIARGEETGHFHINGNTLHSYDYASNYHLLGISRDYTLDSNELGQIPDRQSAIVGLALNAASNTCQQACPVHYRDHRGRNKTMFYHRLPDTHMAIAGITTQALRLELSDPDKPDKRILMALHPELPGLLLEMEYFNEGKRKGQLSLTSMRRY